MGESVLDQGVTTVPAGRKPHLLARVARRLKRTLLPVPLEPKIPPLRINYNYGGARGRADYIRGFKADACLKELPFLIKRCGLTPNSGLLDYGCGFGRLAYAASNYLAGGGAYFGYEPNQTALDFLKTAYADRKNFFFSGQPLAYDEDYIAIRHAARDAAGGGVGAADIDLGFVTRPIDAEWTCSVFTHMWADPITRVLRSCNGIMAAGGWCINTWLCVDDFASYTLRCGLADRDLSLRVNGALTTTLDNPLACTAYELSAVREIYARAGHRIEEILWGSWSGRENGVSYQDIIVSRPIR